MLDMDLMNTRPKAFSYVRFSTPEQSKGDSRNRQANLARDYAERHGLALDERSYEDLGVSAYRSGNVETGSLGLFREAVQLGIVTPGSWLLVESLDRLSRAEPRKAVRLLEDIVDEGVTVVTLNDSRVYSKDTLKNDPTSFLVAFLVAMRAHEESATKAKRLRSAWKTKRATAKTKVLTAIAPAWLTLRADRSGFDVVEEVAAMVRKVYTLAHEGHGQNKIAAMMNAVGAKTLTGKGFWNNRNVRHILSSKNVIGTFVPRMIEERDDRRKVPVAAGEEVEGYYPSIVDASVYYDVQAMADTKAPRGRHANASTVQNVLAGIARCGLCGGTMIRVTKGLQGAYLVCGRAKVKAGCKYVSTRYHLIASEMFNQTGDWAGPRVSQSDATPVANALDSKRTELLNLQDASEALLDAFPTGRRAMPAVVAKIEEFDTEMSRTNAEIKALEAQLVEGDESLVLARWSDVLEAANRGDTKGLNMALKKAVSSVAIDPIEKVLTFHWRHGATTELRWGNPFPADADAA